MTEELLPCPFCGAGEYRIEEKRLHNGVYMDGSLPAVIFGEITHWCEKEEGQPQSIMNFKGRDRGDAIAIWNTRSQPKYKRVDLGLKRESVPIDYKDGSHREWEIHNAAFNDGWNEAIDDIKSKYGDLFIEIKE